LAGLLGHTSHYLLTFLIKKCIKEVRGANCSRNAL
jgi:hypothetical protein